MDTIIVKFKEGMEVVVLRAGTILEMQDAIVTLEGKIKIEIKAKLVSQCGNE